MKDQDLLEAKVHLLERENDELREQIHQLLKSAAPVFALPGLTASENQLVHALYSAPAHITKDRIHTALYGFRVNSGPEPKIIDVFVCKARKKLRPLGIDIETVWGQGYALSPTSRARVSALIKAITE